MGGAYGCFSKTGLRATPVIVREADKLDSTGPYPAVVNYNRWASKLNGGRPDNKKLG